jgi:hypothetical protein
MENAKRLFSAEFDRAVIDERYLDHLVRLLKNGSAERERMDT